VREPVDDGPEHERADEVEGQLAEELWSMTIRGWWRSEC
jgi:hypothetical protein